MRVNAQKETKNKKFKIGYQNQCHSYIYLEHPNLLKSLKKIRKEKILNSVPKSTRNSSKARDSVKKC